MEAVLITKRHKRNYARIQIENHIITSKPGIKYLGVMIDRKLSYKQHVRYAYDKARALGTLVKGSVVEETAW